MTTSTVVLEPTTDTRTARQVARDTRRSEKIGAEAPHLEGRHDRGRS